MPRMPRASACGAPPTAGVGTYGPATSFSTRNVGVNLEMTPKISAAGEITLADVANDSGLGADGWLIKPFVREVLVASVERLLGPT